MKKFYLWPLPKNKHNGSILIEIIVVIAIITILIGLVIPSIKFLNQKAAIAELDKLQIVCSLLQRQSIASGKKETLIFDQENLSYFYNQHNEVLPKDIVFNFIQGSKGPPANPNKKIDAAISFKHQKISFAPNGKISAGTAYIMDKNNNMYALTVPVSQVSFIRKYKYLNGIWTYLE